MVLMGIEEHAGSISVSILANVVSQLKQIIMSNFTCEHCGTPIIDSAQGYATGCDHYPADFRLEHCPDCGKDIVADDDDACVCIQCGGRNRRVRY